MVAVRAEAAADAGEIVDLFGAAFPDAEGRGLSERTCEGALGRMRKVDYRWLEIYGPGLVPGTTRCVPDKIKNNISQLDPELVDLELKHALRCIVADPIWHQSLLWQK